MVLCDWVREGIVEKETITMNTLPTWNPARELSNIGGSLLGFLGTQAPQNNWGLYSTYDWEPAVDIEEDDKEYTLLADLPSVRREDIHVTLLDGSIELSGERRKADETSRGSAHRMERAYGKFGRTFYLPDNADPENLKAELREGTLTVHIPKIRDSVSSRKEIMVE